jgi:hypothetical protein
MSVGVIFGRKPMTKENCGGCEGLTNDCGAGCVKIEKNSLLFPNEPPRPEARIRKRAEGVQPRCESKK